MKNNQYVKGRASAFKECFDAMQEIMNDKDAIVKHIDVQGNEARLYREEWLADYMRSLIVLRIDEEEKIQGDRHAKKKEI